MLIGILSDSHDRVQAMAAGVAILQARGAEHFLHCGDVGSERVLDHLAGLKAAFVWGNTDWDHPGLERYAQTLGITCCGAFGDLTLGGKKIALLHGDDYALKQRLLTDQQHNYLLHGHTHQRLDQRVGKVRVINPGALFRAAQKTVALLDTDKDTVEFIVVEP